MKIRHTLVSLFGVIGTQILFFWSLYLIGIHFGAADLGEFNSQLAFGCFIGNLSALRYELACVSEDRNSTINALFHSVLLSLLILSAVLFCAVIINASTNTLVFVFAFIFFLGQVLTQYFIALREYSAVSFMRLTGGILFVCCIFGKTIFTAIDSVSVFDLYFLSIVVSVFVFFPVRSLFEVGLIKFDLCFYKSNYRFPFYIFPATIFSSILLYALPILFPSLFGAEEAGYFAIAFRIGAFPVSLIAQSVGSVLRRDAVGACTNGSAKKLKEVYIFYAKIIFSFSLLYLVFGYFFGREIILFVFGSSWGKSVEYFMYMLPMFSLQLAYTSLSQIFLATNNQKLDFLLQFMIGSGLVLSVFISVILKLSPLCMVEIFSISGGGLIIVGVFFTAKVGLRDRPV
ncbi:lipopolysaccharide biosynthesis protein [Quatrionicoccus australiensis]|uniref:lipopolysaccharide biosynthesis protein n=1 Tax=Quatrionicoccus australiensis TaxID=138118 RepID=UPI001CFBBB68|nr:hypothetical protein [Quatrionicoccus australiensis]MCB4358673.1 hypothetical protein [Quatrionicoccus australiensis]